MEAPEGDFLAETEAWVERQPTERRKKLGQYMTPRPIREALLDQLELLPGMRVLDPGAGTGEFLASVQSRQPGVELVGWDVDESVLTVARQVVPDAELELRSALEAAKSGSFDLVIGNPPYFQLKMEKELRKRFEGVISGRPNIFALFFQIGLDQLKDGGRLAYVVPPSMNNGAYFDALRNFILERSAIRYLKVLRGNDLFVDANTSVQLIVLEKGSHSNAFTFVRSCPESAFQRTILSERPDLLENLFEGRKSLWEMGYETTTGTVVWNQNRDSLRAEEGSGRVPLIWAENIQDSRLTFGNTRRLQYIERSVSSVGPAIVVNRIVGTVGRGGLRSAIVPAGMRFVGENHVNVIRPRPNASQKVSLEYLQSQLKLESTTQAIRLLTGNTQVSATELNHLLPISDRPKYENRESEPSSLREP